MATLAPRSAVRLLSGLPRVRMVEWGILLSVVLVLMGVLGRYTRNVQGQAERASVVSTLGALRTALVIHHVQAETASGVPTPVRTTLAPAKSTHAWATAATVAPLNPFLTLQTLPPNYGGEMAAVESWRATPGTWVFDPRCPCIGYAPLDATWAEEAPNTPVLWFRVSDRTGPQGLTALAPYLWRGLPVE